MTVAEEVLGHLAVRGRRRSVALNHTLLHVRRRHDELTVLPDTGREPVPGVLRVVGWMRAPVHPDDAVRAAEAARHRVGDERLRHRIENLQNPEVRPGAAHQVLHRVRLRLAFRLRENRRVPGLRLLTIGVVQRQARVVAQFGARRPMWLILVDHHRPVAGDVGPNNRRRGRWGLRNQASPDDSRQRDQQHPHTRKSPRSKNAEPHRCLH